ncbi:MAG: hypothetical protein ACUVRU_06640, partial [Anaerolineae bacterium]
MELSVVTMRSGNLMRVVRRVLSALLVLGVVVSTLVGLAQLALPAQAAPVMPLKGLVLYEDGLLAGWQNWSWDATVDLRNRAPVYSGRRSIAVDLNAPWAGFSLRAPRPIQTAKYPVLTFWVHGGEDADKQLRLFVQETDSGPAMSEYVIVAPAGTWTPVMVSMSELGSPSQIARITIQDNVGQDQGVFYLDRIALLTVSSVLIYDDALSYGWQNWSWDATVNLRNRAPVYSRWRSAAVDLNAPWAGFSLRTTKPLSLTKYSALTFWVHGGDGADKQLYVFIQETDSGPEVGHYEFTAPVGVWTPITVTMSQLDNPSQVARINIKDRTGQEQEVFYVDRVVLFTIANVSQPQTAASAAGAGQPVPAPQPQPPAPPPATGANIYDDALGPGWENWSWSSNVN